MARGARGTVKASAGQVADAWAELDRMLLERKYMRFSIDTTRDWDDANRRQWHAVAFMESGKVLARARRPTRDEAIVALVHELLMNMAAEGRP